MRNMLEHLAVVGTIDPASIAAGTALTDAIALKDHRRVLFLVLMGTMGAGGTADFKVQGATSAGGAYADIPGAAIAQIVKASGDGKIALVEISPVAVENLGLGYTHVKGALAIGTAASPAAVVALGDRARYSEAADLDLADVVQYVTLVN